jgi:hypothetical protein
VSAAPLPDLDWEVVAPFWEAAARRKLVFPRCQGCGRLVWYPAEVCARCETPGPRWTAVSGRGRLFSWAVVERALYAPFRSRAPYVTGLVEIEEDPAVRFVTTLVDVAPSALEMGMPLVVTWGELHFEGDARRVPAPFFTSPRGPGASITRGGS